MSSICFVSIAGTHVDGFAVYSCVITRSLTYVPNSPFQAELGRDAKRIKFTTSDLENLKGSYDTVLCIDVMIHYPTEKASKQPPPRRPPFVCCTLLYAVSRLKGMVCF